MPCFSSFGAEGAETVQDTLTRTISRSGLELVAQTLRGKLSLVKSTVELTLVHYSFGNTAADEKQSIGYPTELDLDGRETYPGSRAPAQSLYGAETFRDGASTVFQPRTTMIGAESIANPQPLPVRKDSLSGSTHFGRQAPSGFQ